MSTISFSMNSKMAKESSLWFEKLTKHGKMGSVADLPTFCLGILLMADLLASYLEIPAFTAIRASVNQQS